MKWALPAAGLALALPAFGIAQVESPETRCGEKLDEDKVRIVDIEPFEEDMEAAERGCNVALVLDAGVYREIGAANAGKGNKDGKRFVVVGHATVLLGTQ